MFYRSKGVADTIQRENEDLKKKLAKLSAERAKIRDMAAKISAGIPTSIPGAKTSTEELVERVRIQTAYREQLALRARLAQMEAEMEAESRRLEEEIARREQQLTEPLSLTLTAPTSGQTVTHNTALNIKWESTGPVGDRLRIGLLKRGVPIRTISYGAPTKDESFSWKVPVPSELPVADDYEISIQDPASGLVSANKIKIQ